MSVNNKVLSLPRTLKSILIISILLIFSGCFSDWQGDGTGTITLNLGSSSRSVMPWPESDDHIHDYLSYVITPIGKNGELPSIPAKGKGLISFNIPTGEYIIHVEAYLTDYETILNPDLEIMLYATGTSKTVYVAAGQTKGVTINMHANFCRTCEYGLVIPGDCENPVIMLVDCPDPRHAEPIIISPALGHDHFESLTCNRDGCNHQYALGDTGPAGGIIFYIAQAGFMLYQGTNDTLVLDTSITAHYLEAWTENEWQIKWSWKNEPNTPVEYTNVPLVQQTHDGGNPARWACPHQVHKVKPPCCLNDNH